MEKILVSVFDKKVKVFSAPTVAMNEAEAERMLKTIANDPGSQIGMYPEDFTLYILGTVNDADGTITPCNPSILIEAHQVVVKSNG